jgi:serine/threonine protein kinase
MAWTAYLQNQDPLYVNKSAYSKVYRLEQDLYPFPIFVKRISYGIDVEFEYAIREEAFARKFAHPHICPVIGICREAIDNMMNIYIISKAMPCSLHVDIEQRSRRKDTEDSSYTEAELWRHFNDMASTLAYLQEQNIAHRDLKPSNILLDDQQQMQLTDFGFAKECSGREHTVLGSQPYLSPDLRRYFISASSEGSHALHDPFKSDVYSLGIVFLYMTALELPQHFTDLQGLQGKLDRYISEQAQGYSANWKAVLRRMLMVLEMFRPDFLGLQHIVEDPLPPASPPQAAPLSLTLRCGQRSLGSSDSTPCLISIRAPSTVARAMDLVLILDLSGNYWVELTRRALSSLVSRLSDNDRVTLVSYEKTSQRLCRFIACTPGGQEELQKIITALHHEEKPHLSDVFKRGLEALRWRLQPNSLAQIILLSDWQGAADYEPLAPCQMALKNAKLEIEHLALTCFALGENSNLSVFKTLVQSTCGSLVPVPNQDSALTTFEQSFDRICTTAAENLTVKLTSSSCQIEQVYSHSAQEDFYLPGISARECKDLVLLLKPREPPSEATQTCALQVSLAYISSSGEKVTIEQSLWITLEPAVHSSSPLAVEASVKWAKARVVARLQEIECKEQDAALAILEELIAEVQVTKVLTELLRDLERAREMLGCKAHWQSYLAAVAYKWQDQVGCFSSQPGLAQRA